MKKHIHYLLLTAVALTAVMLGSCNKDDNESTDDAYSYLRRSFTGKLICQNETRTDSVVMDTLDASWSVNASNKLTIANVPLAKLLVGVDNPELLGVAQALATQTLTADIAVTHVSPIVFTVAPQSLVTTVRFGGADHELRVTFASSPNLSWGSYSTNDNSVVINIVETGVYLDGNSTNVLPKSMPLLWSTQQAVRPLF